MVRLLILAAGLAVATPGGAARAADPAKGHAVFSSQCGICHSDRRGGGVIVGPPLYGVLGRRAGSVASFAYSGTMKAAGFDWTDERLRAYLPGPQTYLPGVKMTYPGLRDPRQLDDLIAYLGTLK